VTSLSIEGVTFTDRGGPSILESLGGWFDGAPVRGEAPERPGQHGDFATPATRGGRLITAAVTVVHDSPAEAEATQQRITALLADGGFGELEVTSAAGQTLSARVRLGGQPLVRWVGMSHAIRAQLQFFAPDPLRYSAPIVARTGFPVLRGGLRYDLYTDGAGTNLGWLDYGEPSDTGRLSLTNDGNADVWPVFEVTGPVEPDGFEVVRVGSGQRIRFQGPVPAGSPLVIDSATGLAMLDGTADRGDLLTVREWSPVRPGETAEFAFINLGPHSSAQLTAVIRPGRW